MQTTRRELMSLLLIGLCSLAAIRAGAQGEGAGDDSGGAFTPLHADGPKRAQSVASDAGRPITLALHQATLKEALRAVARQAEVQLIYNDGDLPAGRLVTVTISDATVERALALVLRGTTLQARRTEGGIAIEPRNHHERSERRLLQGSVNGRVTDAATGRPIPAVAVRLEEVSLATSTSSEGAYRFPAVPAGTYTLMARQVGYERVTQTVVVKDGEDLIANLAMTRSPTILDQVVTTGTLIPTEVKALPTPVSVITSEQIDRQHALSMMAIVRQAVPTAVVHDAPNVPANTDISVRGASSLDGPGNVKIFVDGVEASSSYNAAVDPASIDRIEVIRGPQAATLYGADAAGGVIQIFTKRGDSSLARPRVNARVGMGLTQTPYANFEHVLRQQYSGSVYGGAPSVSYRLGGGYKRLADYVAENARTRQSASSVYGSMNFSRGILAVDLSGRYYRNTIPQARNPELFATGYVPYSKPLHTRVGFTNETYGARVIVSPTDWWRHQVTVGVDRLGIANVQTQPRYTTPSDSLLKLSESMSRKLSVGYNTTASGTIGHSLDGSLTIGVDHYSQAAGNVFASRILNPRGPIVTVPAGGISVTENSVANTGYFAQAQLALRDAIFLTAGVRAEDNASFGRDYGLATLPRVGVSLVQPVGGTTLKLRASYGRALRTPGPNEASGEVGPGYVRLANPDLAPERQQGWDAGVDLIVGNKGSLSISGFDQTALDLIAFLTVGSTPVVTDQYRNIGRVSNKGIELEGVLRPTPSVTLSAQYGYVRSRITAVGAAGGQVQPGDPPINVPARTAGVSLTVATHFGTTINAGLAYVGSFRAMDWVPTLRCFASFSPSDCPSSFLTSSSYRDFIVRYPAFAKLNASVTHRFNPRFEAFLAIDNLTNQNAFEADNSTPVVGRTTMLGFDVTY
jgi:outer membrane receptor protein involved in Fe transport